MKRAYLLLLTAFLILATVNRVHAQNEQLWIVGRVSSEVTEKMYNMIHYYEFTLIVVESNGTLAIGDQIIALAETNTTVKPEKDKFYNYTGFIVETQQNDIPAGFFVIETVSGEAEADWITILKHVVGIISGWFGAMIDAIVQLVYVGTGYTLPAILVTAVIAGFAFYMLIKHYKSIGLIFVLALGFLIVSGFANLIRLAWA